MRQSFDPPTPVAEINILLAKLLAGAQRVLGARLVGMYLYGSLASGDFNPRSSDIDFVFVTEGELPFESVAGLDMLHQGLWASGEKWAQKLEGAYVSRQTIRRHDPGAPPCPMVNERLFYVDRLGSDWMIQRHVLRTCGATLAGPPPESLIDPVMPDDVRQAVREVLEGWWTGMLDDPAFLRQAEYQAFAALTMCRAGYALQSGEIISKPAAARWALQNLPTDWHGLIEQALAWPEGEQPDRLEEVLELIRFILSGLAPHSQLSDNQYPFDNRRPYGQ